MKANYRKINDHTHNSSTYHKKDGTNVRAKMKQQLQQEVNSQDDGEGNEIGGMIDLDFTWENGKE